MDYQVRGIQTMIVQTANGLHNHGFREHKSLAIYAFLVLKFHCVRPVAHNENSTPLSDCYKLPIKYAWFAVRIFDVLNQGGNSKL
jgi:hypothetical protein